MNVLGKWIMAMICLLLVGHAQAQNVHGILRVVKGDVQIKSAKGEINKARIGGKVFPKDVIITGKDARAKIVMVDKNEINVSPDSQIEIQHYEYDPNNGKKDVLLNVIYGKVRSKVEQKYDGKTTKFQIKTPSAVAGVRGTDFLMSFNKGSRSSQVVTFEGKVEFGLPGPGGSIRNPVLVAPGQFASNAPGQAPNPPAPMPKEELAKMDNESKSELPKTDGTKSDGQDQRSPAGDDEKEKNENSAEDKKSDTTKPEDKDDKKAEGNKQDESKSSDENKSAQGNGKGNNGNGNGNGGAAERTPSSLGPKPEGPSGPGPAGPGAPSPGSMFRPEDFANNSIPTIPVGPAIMMPPLMPLMPINNLAPCDFCNTVINDNKTTNLIIKVNGP